MLARCMFVRVQGLRPCLAMIRCSSAHVQASSETAHAPNLRQSYTQRPNRCEIGSRERNLGTMAWRREPKLAGALPGLPRPQKPVHFADPEFPRILGTMCLRFIFFLSHVALHVRCYWTWVRHQPLCTICSQLHNTRDLP